jgi:hypothetical protein
LPSPSRRLFAATAASALALTLWGCSSVDDWSTSRSDPAPIGTLGPGFIEPNSTPAPEATISPAAGSWDDVHPPEGYRVVLLDPTYDATAEELVAAVTEWAKAERVSLKIVDVDTPGAAVENIVAAMELGPDLIVSAGPGVVDALALVTASHLDRQFLILGAQVPEPTMNVTAAIWPGAASRGSEVPDSEGTFDPAAFTQDAADVAIRAGVASVLHGLTGIVLQLD